MPTSQSAAYDKENIPPKSLSKWGRKKHSPSSRTPSRGLVQETWDRFKNGVPFQRPSAEPLSCRSRNHDRNSRENYHGSEASAPENLVSGDTTKKVIGSNGSSESVEHTGTDFSKRNKWPPLPHGTRDGEERSESDKKNHVHFVLSELKTKVRRSQRPNGSRISTQLFGFSEAPQTEASLPEATKIEADECDAARAGNQCRDNDGRKADTKSPSSAMASSSKHDDQGGNIGNWLSKVARIPRNASTEVLPARKFRPISIGKSRGGLLGLGRGAQNTPKLGNFFQNIVRDQDASPDRGAFKRNRGPTGKRGFQGVLRRVKSFESGLNASQTVLPFVFRNSSKKGRRHSELLAEVDFLEKSLWDCELMLAVLVDRQAKIRDKFSLEIEDLKHKCASLNRTQEIHYRSVLDVFNENCRIIGCVESHFVYLMSLIPKPRPGTASDFMIDILRLMGDNAVATMLKMVGGATSLYSYFFPRKRNTRV